MIGRSSFQKLNSIPCALRELTKKPSAGRKPHCLTSVVVSHVGNWRDVGIGDAVGILITKCPVGEKYVDRRVNHASGFASMANLVAYARCPDCMTDHAWRYLWTRRSSTCGRPGGVAKLLTGNKDHDQAEVNKEERWSLVACAVPTPPFPATKLTRVMASAGALWSGARH
jgi:hypothetical protein